MTPCNQCGVVMHLRDDEGVLYCGACGILKSRAVTTTEPNSWKLGCKTHGDSEWAYNSFRFKSFEECDAYGADLYSRWTALQQYEPHPSDDQPNR